MRFKSGSTELYEGVPFTLNNKSFPKKWLTVASDSDLAAEGITKSADLADYDSRFYTGYDSSDNLIAKNVATIKTEQKRIQSEHCRVTLTHNSDTMALSDRTLPTNWRTYRQQMRDTCDTRKDEIDACSDIASLEALLKDGGTITDWPDQPSS